MLQRICKQKLVYVRSSVNDNRGVHVLRDPNYSSTGDVPALRRLVRSSSKPATLSKVRRHATQLPGDPRGQQSLRFHFACAVDFVGIKERSGIESKKD
jgi:hypothetical protein